MGLLRIIHVIYFRLGGIYLKFSEGINTILNLFLCICPVYNVCCVREKFS